MNHRLADRLGDESGRRHPRSFAIVHQPIAVGILNIIGNSITVAVQRIAIAIHRHIMITDVHRRTSFNGLIGLRGEMVKPHLIRRGAAGIDQ